VLFISASLSCQTVVTIRRGQIHWNKRSRLLLRGYEIFGKYLIEGAAFAGCQVIIRVRFSRREDCCALANLVAGAKGPLLNIRSLAIVIFGFGLGFAPVPALAAARAGVALEQVCPRPAPGSTVTEPKDLRSHNGILKLELTYRNFIAADGQEQYCYQYKDGSQAPTLRLQPADQLILRLKNKLTALPQSADKPVMQGASASAFDHVPTMATMPIASPCASAQMTALSTNLHFHGTTVPPVCHQDDVLHTLIQPGDSPFEYRLRIPADEPPGLYWYHPHVHGFTNPQVLGGASGALIVEGIERANRKLAGLPERVFVIRDQELLHPEAVPAKSGLMPPPPVLRDAEGDILNTGTGEGKPAKDLSINFVPVPYPDFQPAVIMVKPSERQLWRIVNASAVTYLDLQVLVDNQSLSVGVVALDGVPITENGMARDKMVWVNHVFLPPSGRVEWVFKGVPAGAHARLITRSVDTGRREKTTLSVLWRLSLLLAMPRSRDRNCRHLPRRSRPPLRSGSAMLNRCAPGSSTSLRGRRTPTVRIARLYLWLPSMARTQRPSIPGQHNPMSPLAREMSRIG
jgi:FtsP/CotA-like multicopper oxidase with cupredoxin domain